MLLIYSVTINKPEFSTGLNIQRSAVELTTESPIKKR